MSVLANSKIAVFTTFGETSNILESSVPFLTFYAFIKEILTKLLILTKLASRGVWELIQFTFKKLSFFIFKSRMKLRFLIFKIQNLTVNLLGFSKYLCKLEVKSFEKYHLNCQSNNLCK